MNGILQAFLIIGTILYFIVILSFLRKKSMTLKYSLLWILGGIVMLIAAIFPGTMVFVSNLLGIELASNAVFALGLFFLMLILMSMTSIVSIQSEKIKRMTQAMALMEKRIRELEEEKEGK